MPLTDHLETLSVQAEVVRKALSTSLQKRLLDFGTEAKILCEATDPVTGQKFIAYTFVTKQIYDDAKVGGSLTLKAYRGKNQKLYFIKPSSNLLN